MAILSAFELENEGISIPAAYCKVTSFRWNGGSSLSVMVSVWASQEAKEQEKRPIRKNLVDVPFDLSDPDGAANTLYNELKTEIYNYLKQNQFAEGVDI